MSDLDRRVAVEIMGEFQPSTAQVTPALQLRSGYSPGGGWQTTHQGIWKPLPFSTDLNLVMKAVDKLARDIGLESIPNYWLSAIYPLFREGNPRWIAHFAWDVEGKGTTLPEAICNLLLALKEKP